MVAPTLHAPACQEQLTAAVREVTQAVENLVAVCNETCASEELMNQLKEAAAEVTRTLNDLLNHIKLGKSNHLFLINFTYLIWKQSQHQEAGPVNQYKKLALKPFIQQQIN